MTNLAKNAHKPAAHDSASAPSTQTGRPRVDPKYIQTFVENLFGDDLHAMRVLSLANGVVGILHAAVLAIHAIGQAYAKFANIKPKSGVKQVDRLLSNTGIDVIHSLRSWVEFVIGVRKEIVVALDWTDFEKDDHTTLCAYLVTRHGRATPLVWKTVKKSALKGTQKDHEYELIRPSQALRFLAFIGWDFVIRFRGGIVVENAAGEARPADAWVPASRRATMLREVRVTGDRAKVAAVVLVHTAGSNR